MFALLFSELIAAAREELTVVEFVVGVTYWVKVGAVAFFGAY
jgi:hypothetical protein